MQSRAIIPSWYGVGHAFEHYCTLDDCTGEGLVLLQAMYHEWPFFRALIQNVELDLAKADMGIAEQYAALVEDAALRDSDLRGHPRGTRPRLPLYLPDHGSGGFAQQQSGHAPLD